MSPPFKAPTVSPALFFSPESFDVLYPQLVLPMSLKGLPGPMSFASQPSLQSSLLLSPLKPVSFCMILTSTSIMLGASTLTQLQLLSVLVVLFLYFWGTAASSPDLILLYELGKSEPWQSPIPAPLVGQLAFTPCLTMG